MILVTGTKRSGTSMWMQILAAAGLPWIGEEYMGSWADSIRDANPKGFYESQLRQGVFYATNPHPATGAFLRPEQTRRHAVKVFIPGLVRTDFAYIDKVVATMRPWREYVRSIQRLYAMEDAHHLTLDGEARTRAQASVARSRPQLPPEVEWWFEHYELIRDVAARRYPVHLTTYRRMMANPEPEIKKVLTWLDIADHTKALATVDRALNTQRPDACADVTTELEPAIVEVMDELHERITAGKPLSDALVGAMNEHQQTLIKRYGTPSRDRMREEVPT